MKIPGSIARLYANYKENAETTKNKVKDMLEKWCNENHWHFDDRIKSELSFAQKIETGRYDSESVDDVYACTIIVRNRSEIEQCIGDLKSKFYFRFVKQVPENINKSNMRPEYFGFDSVRLYFKPAKEDVGPNPYENQIFEIQVKTLIEHAWSLAMHDFHYKSNITSWARSRVSSQIKALLDSAELAIVEAKNLSESAVVKKDDWRLDKINDVISYFKEEWGQDQCPKDLKRLAENVLNLLNPIKKDLEWLKRIIEKETKAGRGKQSLNLPPYWIILQSIINEEGSNFFTMVEKYQPVKNKQPLPIIDEIVIPPDVNLDEFKSFLKL